MSRACVRLFTRLARPRASPFEAESATALSVPACARACVCPRRQLARCLRVRAQVPCPRPPAARGPAEVVRAPLQDWISWSCHSADSHSDTETY